MATVICAHCGKPWMDYKHTKCPSCGTPPSTQPDPEPTLGDSSGVSTQKVVDGLTRQQGERIIALLDTGRYSPLADKAYRAGQMLDGLALFVLFLGVLGAVGSFVIMASVSVGLGLVYLLCVVFGTALYWGLLTAASVVTEYVWTRTR